MAVKFQLRRDTAANWTSANPVLDLGEPGVETDTLKLKIGNGSTPWNSLDYSVIRDFAELANKPTTLAGYGITDAATSAQGALADTALQPGDGLSGAFVGDVTGSVFADDSTLLVDAVNGIVTADVTGNLTGNVTGDLTGNVTGDLTGNVTGQVSDLSNHDTDDLTEGTNKYFLTSRVDDHLSGGTGVDYTTGTISIGQAVGTTDSVEFVNIKATGYIEGPATFTIDPAAVGDNTGTVVIAGDLQVDGTTTTINSQTLEVEDKNVVLGPNAANDAANNGAGITVTQPDTSDATLIYNTTDTQWELNKDLDVTGVVKATEINLDATGDIHSTVDTGYVGIAGGTNSNVGANALFYGGTHATLAGVTKFRSGSTGTVTILANGNVGIGYDSPTDNIHILGSNASPNVGITLQSDDTANATAAISLFARDASNVNKVSEIKNVAGQLFIERSDAGTDVLALKSTSAGVGGPQLDFYHHSASPADNDVIGTINFNGWDSGSNPTTYARMSGVATDVTNGSEKGDLLLSTRTDASTFSEKVRIKYTGNVGIGTDDPDQLLQVYQQGVVGNNYNEGRIKVGGASSVLGLEIGYNSSSSGRAVITSLNTTGGINNRLSLGFGAIDSNGEPGTTNVMTLNQAGNVGIGVSQPGHRLHIEEDYGATPLVHFDNSGSQATHGPALKVSASGRGVGVKDASIFSVHNLNGEIFSVRNDGHSFSQNYILNAIDTDISDTAVDVFVYDTSKDSDGGAWRKRTQHTSWYNEELNTSDRGSRREFPAVAVIVADNVNDTVTIYDADDPDLPMWMVFIAGTGGVSSTYMVQSNGGDLSCVEMLNGKLVVGRSNNASSYGIPIIDFISEKVVRLDSEANGGEGGSWLGNIADRNSTVGYVADDNDYDTISSGINDVAMIVMPDASIDTATGLPVPTIAVATSSGISVIKDDGTVVSSATYDGTRVAWTSDYKIVTNAFENFSPADAAFVLDYPSLTALRTYRQNTIPSITGKNFVNHGFHNAIATSPNRIYGANYVDGSYTNTPLVFVDYYDLQASQSTDMVCYIESNFNTGWLPGDIKLVLLSDTDTTNLSDSSVVTNGTFDANVSGWYGDSGATVSWNAGGYADVGDGGGDNTYAIAQAGILESGAKYMVSFRINPNNSSNVLRLRLGGAGTQWTASNLAASTWHEIQVEIVEADGTTLEIGQNGGSATAFSIDDIVVRKLSEPDRSVANNGLAVVGTINKDPVATGADLVAYSGFADNTNYLSQPPNSDMDFGTGDFSVMLWHYHSDATLDDTIYFVSGKSTSNAWQVGAAGSDQSYLWVIGGSINARSAAGTVIEQAWTHLAYVRRSGVTEIWINGVLIETDTDTTDVDSNEGLEIPLKTACGDGNDLLALLRISATAPSAEQIKKIYEDEKFLFLENSKCTLYGGNSITALAYDDGTNLLHAGNSSGRNVFQGLRRVDNTTDAVTVAISASNGLVAED
jgi:hypothetical protein